MGRAQGLEGVDRFRFQVHVLRNWALGNHASCMIADPRTSAA